MYTLIATNESGACVEFYGESKSQVLGFFDFHYERSGFRIIIITPTDRKIEFKKTFK